MSKAPPGAMSSPYIGGHDEKSSNDISYTELAKRALNIMDNMHPEVKGEDMNKPQPVPPAIPAKPVTVKPEAKPKFLDIHVESNVNEKFETVAQNAIIDLLRANKLTLVSLSDNKLVFELNGKCYLITPV